MPPWVKRKAGGSFESLRLFYSKDRGRGLDRDRKCANLAVMEQATTERPATMNVARETWRRLNLLRQDPREKFDDVIRRLLDERESATEAGRKG